MPAITATPVPDKGYVRVQVDYQGTAATGVLLKRYPTGSDLNFTTPAVVRGATPLSLYTGTAQPKPYVKLSAAKAIFYDHEAPFGQSLTYTAESDLDTTPVPGPNLLRNPSFEVDTNGWVPINAATVTRSTDVYATWPVNSTASAKVVCTTAGRVGVNVIAGMPITEGKTYTVSVWVYTPVAGKTAEIHVDWQNAAASAIILGAIAPSVSIPANTATRLTYTGVAPAGSALIRPYVQLNAAAVNDVAYFDAFRAYEDPPASAVVNPTSAPVTLAPVTDVGWLKDPQRPALNLKLLCGPADIAGVCDTGQGVHFVGLGGRRFAADAKNIDVPGAARGSMAYSVRKEFTSTLRVVTRTLPDRDALVALLASGAPLLLQLPSQYGEPDQYIQVGELSEDRLHQDHRVPWRGFTLPYTVEDAPVGQAQGTSGARWRDLSRYATWTALKATGVTWDGLGTV